MPVTTLDRAVIIAPYAHDRRELTQLIRDVLRQQGRLATESRSVPILIEQGFGKNASRPVMFRAMRFTPNLAAPPSMALWTIARPPCCLSMPAPIHSPSQPATISSLVQAGTAKKADWAEYGIPRGTARYCSGRANQVHGLSR